MKLLIAICSILTLVACNSGDGGGIGGLNTGEPMTTQPGDKVLNPGDEISITMGFGLDADKVNSNNITFGCEGEGIDDGPIPIDVIYNKSNRKINIVPNQPLVSGTNCLVTFSAELNAEIVKAQQSGITSGPNLGRVAGNRPTSAGGGYEYQKATPYVGLYTPPGQEPSQASGDVTTSESIISDISWGFSVSSSASGAAATAPSGSSGDDSGEGSADGWDVEGL